MDEDLLHRSHPAATVAFGDLQSEQAEVMRFADGIHGEDGPLLPCCGVGGHGLGGELLRELLQHGLILGEGQIGHGVDCGRAYFKHARATSV